MSCVHCINTIEFENYLFWTLYTAQVSINLTFRTFVLFLSSVTWGAYTKATESSRNKHVKVDRDSVVGIATRYGLDGPGIDFPHPSRSALGPTQPPIQWVPGLSPGVKRPGRGVDHPPHLAPRFKKE